MSNADEPAFPLTPVDKSGPIAETQWGLSKREYFATKAMAAILSNNDEMRIVRELAKEEGHLVGDVLAQAAVEYTYRLLKRLEHP